MRKLSGFLYDHKWATLITWLVILVGFLATSRAVGPDYKFDVNIDSSESIQGIRLLEDNTPEEAPDTLTIVWRADEGKVTDTKVKEKIENLFTEVKDGKNISNIINPYEIPQLAAVNFSKDSTTGYATINLDGKATDVPPSSIKNVLTLVEEANLPDDGITIGISGEAIRQANPPSASFAEIVGIAVALLVLILAFGSLLSAVLPIITAGIALGTGIAVMTLSTHVFSIPSFAPQLVSLLGIGVGVDYALFVVSRHRAGLMRGKPVRESVVESLDTSGRAVIFAGITVMISLFGMMITGIGFLSGLAIAASIGVFFTMLVTITLLPALLAFLGMKVLGKKATQDLQVNGPHDDERSTRWGAWADHIQQRPWRYIIAATVVLLTLTIPVAGMRLGSTDQGSDAKGTSTRLAYDMMADGFGPGYNGPILIISDDTNQALGDLTKVQEASKELDNVVTVTPIQFTPNNKVGFYTIIPKTGPQDEETSNLIRELRETTIPAVTGEHMYVSGSAAVFDDFASILKNKLPFFLLGVLGLSSLLLLVVFRSIAIAVKAAIMNLLVAGASFGILTVVFQWGWGAEMFGIDRLGPIDAFFPILLLAILFGLSMDYQVFLVSRIQEEWTRYKDNRKAVNLGLSETGKVITAAAMIMILVFFAFVFGGERIIKMAGLGLAAAVFLDAFIVRSLLVPALMQVLGEWNWWIPKWLDRILPHITIEHEEVEEKNSRALQSAKKEDN